jgi:hypothetical protein
MNHEAEGTIRNRRAEEKYCIVIAMVVKMAFGGKEK